MSDLDQSKSFLTCPTVHYVLFFIRHEYKLCIKIIPLIVCVCARERGLRMYLQIYIQPLSQTDSFLSRITFYYSACVYLTLQILLTQAAFSVLGTRAEYILVWHKALGIEIHKD